MEEEGQVQWEYKNVGVPYAGDSPERLDKLGREGWEAYATTNTNNPQLLLKRKVVRSKQKSSDYDYGR